MPLGRSGFLIPLLGAALLVGCGSESGDLDTRTPWSGPELFRDVTQAAGMTHVHYKPNLDPKLENIMSWVSSVGAAAAAGDYDGDGWIDLYVTNSRKKTPNHLYHNNGDGTFTDLAAEAGVADLNDDNGTSMDCVWGDYDNDGRLDLYLVRWGTDRLFRNAGDGTFVETTAQCFHKTDGSAGTDWANGNGVVWLDFNLDGLLDLYVGNYFREDDLWNLESTRIMHTDFERARNGGLNFLYRQETDGTFTEIAQSLGLEDPGWTLAVGSADVNNDGWPDLYCANDFGPDQLFLNDANGGFQNVSDGSLGFDSKKGMNVDFGDFNNDGWLDIYVTNITTADYLQEGNMLWHNNGPGPGGLVTFTDISLEAGAYNGGWGWGAKFLDADNDGHLDIISGNGFITAGDGDYWYDLASWTVLDRDPADAANWPTIGDRSFSGREQIRFWRGAGSLSFTEMAQEVGLTGTWDGRGVVCFDYDNDGDLDVYFANQGQPPNLYRNDLASTNHHFQVVLEADPATGVNRSGIGSRVTIVTDSGRKIRERDGGNGYSGQSDPRLHFGIGSDTRVHLCEVRWPDGGLQYLEDLPADTLVVIHQDPGLYLDRVRIDVGTPTSIPRAGDGEPSKPLPEPDDLEPLLSEMEEGLRASLDRYGPPRKYRYLCGKYGRHDRAIEFFRTIVDENPTHARAKIELALAYVDKIPTCGGLAAIVSKGTLARRSLDQLEDVIELEGSSWVVHYCLGMNHLYWPRALRHSDDSIASISVCVALQEESGDPAGHPYYERSYLILGDAYTKAREYAKARAAWRRGLELFPNSNQLRERLEDRSDSELLEFVESRRTLEDPIDTDLSFLDDDS